MSGANDPMEQELQRYLSGRMSAQERHAFERRALDDPFLMDALEGAEQLSPEEFEADVRAIKARIVRSKRPFVFWRIAAVVALLIVSGWSVWWLTREEIVDPVARNQEQTEEEQTSPPIVEEPTEEPQESPEVVPKQKPKPRQAKPTKPTEETEPLVPEKEEDSAWVISDDEVVLEDFAVAEALAEEEEVREKVAKAEADAAKKETVPTQQPVVRRSAASGAVARSRAIEGQTVSGTVMDENGEALPGVNVVIKGTTIGVTTDLDGHFTIERDGGESLVFMAVGMSTQEVRVGERTRLDVTLTTDSRQLQEVVVTGYAADGSVPTGFEPAVPVGGFAAYREYLEQELNYPQAAQEAGVSGRVVLQLSLDEAGTVTEVEVKKSLGYGCDEEAIRLVTIGPKWTPAHRDGQPVKSKVRVRVKFELE